jgi:hypothetical protein
MKIKTYLPCRIFGHKNEIKIHYDSFSQKTGRIKLVFVDMCTRKQCGVVEARFTGEARFKTKKELDNAIKSGEITIDIVNQSM